MIRPAKADVGGEGVGQGHVLHLLAVGADDGDAAVHQGGYADVALGIDGHRVEALVVPARCVFQNLLTIRSNPS